MKFFYSVLFVPLLSVVGVQTASAQPASLTSVYRNSKVQVTFSDSTSVETSSLAIILPDPKLTRYLPEAKVSFKIPGIEGKKATVKSIRKFSLSSSTFCKQPVEYFEIRRAADTFSGTSARSWRAYANASNTCPKVTTIIDITNFSANMTGGSPDSAEGLIGEDGQVYIENTGAVDVNRTSTTAWEAILKYKNGKIIKLKFLSQTV